MAQMSTRIRELEDALGSLQATVSAEPHPLLDAAPEDEDRPRSPIPVATIAEGGATMGDQDELAEALGYLTIRPFGEAQFHGETASSEVCEHVISVPFPLTRLCLPVPSPSMYLFVVFTAY